MKDFIARIDFGLYFILGVLAILFARSAWLARREELASHYPVQRDIAKADVSRAAGGLAVVAIVFGFICLYSGRAASVAQSLVPTATATATATPTFLPPTITLTPTFFPEATPTATLTGTSTLEPTPLPPSPTATATPLPQLVVVEETPSPTPDLSQGTPPNCADPGALITRPGNGALVAGLVEVAGIAAIENFDYYKFEIRVPDAEWSFLQHFSTPVEGGILGSWNSDILLPGRYEFRLVVVDVNGNYPEPCVIQLVVQ